MNSQQVKQAFKVAGLKVRVADQGHKFRVCQLGNAAFDKSRAVAVAVALGLTDSLAVAGAQFNQEHELIGYKPGAFRRI